MDGEDSSSSASTSSSNNGNPPSREQRFYFSNDHFDLKNHLGDRGILLSGIEQLNLSSDDVIVKVNKKVGHTFLQMLTYILRYLFIYLVSLTLL